MKGGAKLADERIADTAADIVPTTKAATNPEICSEDSVRLLLESDLGGK